MKLQFIAGKNYTISEMELKCRKVVNYRSSRRSKFRGFQSDLFFVLLSVC